MHISGRIFCCFFSRSTRWLLPWTQDLLAIPRYRGSMPLSALVSLLNFLLLQLVSGGRLSNVEICKIKLRHVAGDTVQKSQVLLSQRRGSACVCQAHPFLLESQGLQSVHIFARHRPINSLESMLRESCFLHPCAVHQALIEIERRHFILRAAGPWPMSEWYFVILRVMRAANTEIVLLFPRRLTSCT